MTIPHWNRLSLEDKRAYVRSFFETGEVKKATREQLEDYLIVLANPQTEYKDEHEQYSVAIRQLLQSRNGEELHRRSMRVSIAAITISFLALIISGWKAWDDHRRVSPQGPSKALVDPPSQIAPKN